MPHRSLFVVLAILAHKPQSGLVQEVQWPIHTLCNMDKLQIAYRSCDHSQDIGISIDLCPATLSPLKINVNLRVSLLLRQSTDELYLSAKLILEGGVAFQLDEPLCQPDFPRFTFCSRKKGELIVFDTPLKLDKLKYLPEHLNVHTVIVNQNGYHIACFNITIIKR
uniref:MD-2-related lipid-recognition domain-containing protein n=1 Tax=Esox lucius TaxID=8010 RepID=A0A3P9A7K5_ESOLU